MTTASTPSVHLTDYENRMLAGEFGRAKQKALKFIVEYAGALGAEHLVEVRKAQLFVGAHHYLRSIESDDIDDVISAMYLNSDDRVELEGFGCFVQSDAGAVDAERWRNLGIEPAQQMRNKLYKERLRGVGLAEGNSCASYLIGFVPLRGEHYVSTESHALLFMNAVWGACANADSIEASVCAAVCGRTALWGMHVAENRAGTYLIEVDAEVSSVRDWDLLGYVVGKSTPSGEIPVLSGRLPAPEVEDLKSCFAAMSTSGSAEMCHIIGITPEAPTLAAAFTGGAPKATIKITDGDLQRAAEEIGAQGRGPVEYVSLGCPHYSLKQIQYVAEWFRTRRVAPGVRLDVWTAPATLENARSSGFVDLITAAGGQVVTSTCPLVSQAFPKVDSMAFDSIKQAKYMASSTQAQIFAGSVDDCLVAATAGSWKAIGR